MGYDKFWDIISVENTLFYSANQRGLAKGLKEGLEQGLEQGLAKGLEQGLAKGLEQGLEQGMAKGLEQGKIQMAKKMKALNIDVLTIAQVSGLTAEEIEQL